MAGRSGDNGPNRSSRIECAGCGAKLGLVELVYKLIERVLHHRVWYRARGQASYVRLRFRAHDGKLFLRTWQDDRQFSNVFRRVVSRWIEKAKQAKASRRVKENQQKPEMCRVLREYSYY